MLFNFFTKAYGRIITCALILAILTPAALGSLPKKAEAGFSNCTISFLGGTTASKADALSATPTSVPVLSLGSVYADSASSGVAESSFLHDCIEHGLALAIAKMLLDQMTNDIVNWINGGFNGSPAFMSNPAKFLTNAADEVAGAFILGSDLAFLCSPFKLQIQLALSLNYSYSYDRKVACTLSDVVNNVEDAFNSFSDGGWGGWFSITQNDQNNPYGSYLSASSQLGAQIQGAQNTDILKANWGSGFLSWESCTKKDGSTYHNYGGGSIVVGDNTKTLGTSTAQANKVKADDAQRRMRQAEAEKDYDAYGDALNDYDSTLGQKSVSDDCKIQTPGKLIGDQLSNTLKIPGDQLGLADDLDKIFNALAFQFLKKGGEGILSAVGGQGQGLSSTGGKQSIYERLTKDAEDAKVKEQTNADSQQNKLNKMHNEDVLGNMDQPTGQNIAVNKTAKESQPYQGHGPEKLTDGNRQGSYTGDSDTYFGSATGILDNPWMMINLEKTYDSIGKIIVYQRTNPGDWKYVTDWIPYPQFTVEILDKNLKKVWESKKYYQDYKGPTEIDLPKEESGQYVRINGIGHTILWVTEIEVYEGVPPQITINGADPLIINKGDTFVDPGATAKDNVDGSLTAKIQTTSDVNTAIEGDYSVTYTVKNSRGATATQVRNVIVQSPPQTI